MNEKQIKVACISFITWVAERYTPVTLNDKKGYWISIEIKGKLKTTVQLFNEFKKENESN